MSHTSNSIFFHNCQFFSNRIGLFHPNFVRSAIYCIFTMVPAYIGLFLHNLILMTIVAVASFTIFWKHRENIGRLIRREEIGLRSTMRGDKRLDK